MRSVTAESVNAIERIIQRRWAAWSPAHGESNAPAGGGEPGNGQEPEAPGGNGARLGGNGEPQPAQTRKKDGQAIETPDQAMDHRASVAQALPELEGHKGECDGRKDDMGVEGDGPQLCMVGHEPHARLDPAQHEAPGRKSDAKGPETTTGPFAPISGQLLTPSPPLNLLDSVKASFP